MKLSALIITVLLFLDSFGQSRDSIISLLQGKNFVAFRSFIKNGGDENGNSLSSNNTLREVIPGYWEGIITPSSPAIARQNQFGEYRLELLATSQEIFFYQIIKVKYKVKADGYEHPVDSAVQTYRNDTTYQLFEKAFLTTCGIALNQDELFLSSAVYGDGCGIAGSPPQDREKLMTLLTKWDYDAVASWLRSPNTERQLYAMEGLKILEGNGVPIRAEDRALITRLTHKKGMVRTCGGCFWDMESTRAIAQKIDTARTTIRLPVKSSIRKSTLYSGVGVLLLLLILTVAYYWKRNGSVQQGL